jgi:hypothetical protein
MWVAGLSGQNTGRVRRYGLSAIYQWIVYHLLGFHWKRTSISCSPWEGYEVRLYFASKRRWLIYLLFLFSPFFHFFSRWLSNVEISTHSPHLRLLWIGCPQFSFRTYQTGTSLAPSSSSPPYRSSITSFLHYDGSFCDHFLDMPDLLSTSPPHSFFGDHDFSSGQSNTTGSSNTNTPAMGVLFDENAMIPTKRIDIRRHEPLPFKERCLSISLPPPPPPLFFTFLLFHWHRVAWMTCTRLKPLPRTNRKWKTLLKVSSFRGGEEGRRGGGEEGRRGGGEEGRMWMINRI